MADINGIANLPAQTPTGSSLLAIENSTETGNATVDDVVGASTPVSNLVANIGGRAIRAGLTDESTVTFDTAFSAVPFVVCTARNSTTGVVMVVKLTSVTASGFTVERKYWSTANATWADSSTPYNWVAIGTP